jgi:hypothetical protein
MDETVILYRLLLIRILNLLLRSVILKVPHQPVFQVYDSLIVSVPFVLCSISIASYHRKDIRTVPGCMLSGRFNIR